MLQSVLSDHTVHGHTLPVVSGIGQWPHHSSTTLCCSPAHVLTSRCWKMTFLTFPRYSSYSMWVRWANLQPSNVKLLRDSVCQKWLKSVHFWRVIQKIKMWAFFWDTVYITYITDSKRLCFTIQPMDRALGTVWITYDFYSVHCVAKGNFVINQPWN